jgi:Tfp pilus assembly PilM family ATPase
LNVGNSYATLVIISDDNLPFVRDLSYAGKAIIEHIALKNNVSSKIVEDVLLGRKKQDDIELMIHDNLESACDKLIIDIAETLCYDAVRRKSDIVKKIFLCGGFALVDGFADLLNSQLPAATTALWNPFDKISYDVSGPCADILRKEGPALAVAAGLAMRTI